jgi:hypothetical protein
MINRQKYNFKILKELEEFLQDRPDSRFIQALWSLNIVDEKDRFYEESNITFNKVKKVLAKRNKLAEKLIKNFNKEI